MLAEVSLAIPYIHSDKQANELYDPVISVETELKWKTLCGSTFVFFSLDNAIIQLVLSGDIKSNIIRKHAK